ncbi:hypothetical protein [Phyllobacterium sp. K27]
MLRLIRRQGNDRYQRFKLLSVPTGPESYISQTCRGQTQTLMDRSGSTMNYTKGIEGASDEFGGYVLIIVDRLV